MARKYELKERARRQARTRERIAEAAVELHRTVGPARTTVKEVAKRAGVHRATVYEHFPDEVALFRACCARWDAIHPPPDIEAWASIMEPTERLRTALSELYAYYDDAGEMLDRVLPDARSSLALARYLDEEWDPLLAWIVETLAAGWEVRGAAARRLRALLRTAVEFQTWKALTGPGKLSSGTAARTMAAAVRCGAGVDSPLRGPGG
jgi:AcrR family transcriptional regulator